MTKTSQRGDRDLTSWETEVVQRIVDDVLGEGDLTMSVIACSGPIREPDQISHIFRMAPPPMGVGEMTFRAMTEASALHVLDVIGGGAGNILMAHRRTDGVIYGWVLVVWGQPPGMTIRQIWDSGSARFLRLMSGPTKVQDGHADLAAASSSSAGG